VVTSTAVVARIASRTAARCASIVSFHSFGMTSVYATTTWIQHNLTKTPCLDKMVPLCMSENGDHTRQRRRT